MSPLLILLIAAVAAFVLLLKFGPDPRRNATDIIVAGLVAVNIAGVLGLGWFVVEMLIHDGVMVLEILSCVVAMSLLAGTTAGALALKRRGRNKTAIILSGVTALPAIFVYGFLVYLNANPIDWR
jgi:TRAP-type C4-dicarboxylate transport system permease small subunit